MKYAASKCKGKSAGLLRLAGLIFAVTVLLMGACLPAMAWETGKEPLDSAWKNVIVPKHRAIISFENVKGGITTFRGQDEDIENSNLNTFYQEKDAFTTALPKLDISVRNESSRVFSMAQASGAILQTMTLEEGREFMGRSTLKDVPTGVLCSSYFTMQGSENNTAFWMELTGEKGRIGRVKLTDIPRPYNKYTFRKTNKDKNHYVYPIEWSRANDMVAWDWNEDGHTDWLISYVSNPYGNDDYKNMKVVFVFVDGLSLYNKVSKGEGKVKFWYDHVNYVTGDKVVDRSPPNSVRTAIGDMNGDGKPEVALYFTKVQGADDNCVGNHMHVLKLRYDGIKDPTWEWLSRGDVGKWNYRENPVAVAVGDLDGDGKAEIATLHSYNKLKRFGTKSTPDLYLDVYKLEGKEIKKIIGGKKVGTTSFMPGGNYGSTPGLEAAIADLNGDGYGELVWLETYDGHEPHKVHFVVAKWPAGLTGTMETSEHYDLLKLVSGWTLHEELPRFSMNVGCFIYPGNETLRNQIGIVTTAPGSDGRMGLRWGIFEWSKSGMQVLGSGNQSNVMKKSYIIPSLIPADLDRGSMVFGEPTGFTVYNSIEPIFITQAPPKHWDILTIDGEEKIMDAFSLLGNYKTMMKGTESKSEGKSTTQTSSGSWGATAGFSVMKNNLQKPSTTIFNVGMKYAGTKAKKNTSGKVINTTFDIRYTAQYEDQIYYRANNHEVWRYPVLTPHSQAYVKDEDGNNVLDEKGHPYRRFIQIIVPREINSSFSPTRGRDVDWYDPLHNALNLFSYPRELGQTRDYPRTSEMKDPKDLWKDIKGVVLATSTGQSIGNPDPSEATVTISKTEHESTLSSLKQTIAGYSNLNLPAWGTLIAKVVNISLNGDYIWGTDSTTTTDASKLGGVTISWPGGANYSSPSGMRWDELSFTTDVAIYTSEGGALSVAYAVRNLKKPYSNSGIWGPDSPYSKTADPALNLPRQWVFGNNKWQKNPNTNDIHRIGGVIFEGAQVESADGVTRQVMPINTEASITFRVFNYSFIPTGQVTATLAFQPIANLGEKPDISKANELKKLTLDPIPGRDSVAIDDDNWQDVKIDFTTPGTQALGYLHISLTTEGDNLSTENDKGHILVGVYDPAEHNFVSNSTRTMVANTAAGQSLSIKPETLTVLPLEDDGTLGADTDLLPVGKTALVTANVRYDNPGAGEDNVLLSVNVYLRDGDGIAGHKIIPLLKNGKENIVRMLYTSKTDGSIPLQMIITSDMLPPLQDADPEGRVARKYINSESGSGCSLGLTPAPAALLLGVPLLLLKKR